MRRPESYEIPLAMIKDVVWQRSYKPKVKVIQFPQRQIGIQLLEDVDIDTGDELPIDALSVLTT